MGTLVRFTESGSMTVDSSMTMAKVSPLTPGTRYQFRLSAITMQGSGEEVAIKKNTVLPREDSGNYAHVVVIVIKM